MRCSGDERAVSRITGIWHVPNSLDRRAQLRSRHPGHQHVAHDQVGLLLARQPQPLGAVRSQRHPVMLREDGAEHAPRTVIVLDDQQAAKSLLRPRNPFGRGQVIGHGRRTDMLLRPDHLDVGIAAEIGIQQERHREGRTHSHPPDADPPAVQFNDAFRKGPVRCRPRRPACRPRGGRSVRKSS